MKLHKPHYLKTDLYSIRLAENPALMFLADLPLTYLRLPSKFHPQMHAIFLHPGRSFLTIEGNHPTPSLIVQWHLLSPALNSDISGFISPEGAVVDSPGRQPGEQYRIKKGALKGRHRFPFWSNYKMRNSIVLDKDTIQQYIIAPHCGILHN